MSSKALDDVVAERNRQMEVEGWTPEHDDSHACATLIAAAPDMYQVLRALCSEEMRERLLDAQQDINFYANTTMAQCVADASALIDQIDSMMAKGRAVIAKAEGRAEKEISHG